MAIPGLSRCFGKSAKEIQKNRQQAGKPPQQATRSLPPGFDATAPIPRKTAIHQPSQMDMFTSTPAPRENNGKAAEIVRRANASPPPASILRKPNEPAAPWAGRSVTFDDTVKTNKPVFSPGDGEEVAFKGTLPLVNEPRSGTESAYAFRPVRK